jgi:two-component system, NtrC family, nitrogen regulation response regulator NtrX
VPPLRERREDIPLLVRHFADLFSRENNFGGPRGSRRRPSRCCSRHRWKGNIRELKNTVERLIIMTPRRHDRRPTCRRGVRVEPRPDAGESARRGGSAPGTLREFKESAERAFLVEKLRENGWNISKTAEVIDTPRSNLYKKLEQYGISQENDG